MLIKLRGLGMFPYYQLFNQSEDWVCGLDWIQLTSTRHEQLVLRHALHSNPDFRWCLSQNCDWGEILDRNTERFECSLCGHEMCFQHQVPWHEGLTCRQYDGHDQPAPLRKAKLVVQLKEAAKKLRSKTSNREGTTGASIDANEALVSKTVSLMKAASKQKKQIAKSKNMMLKVCKPCPGKGCGVSIQRSEGCSRMKCGSCGCDFCFTCLARWEDGHYDSCNNYRGRDGYIQARVEARIEPRALLSAVNVRAITR